MEKSRNRRDALTKALQQLERACIVVASRQKDQDYDFFRDAIIKRFEFTYDLFWKMLKDFLKHYHGVEAASPRATFREVLAIKLIKVEEQQLLMQMLDDRNLTTHTYDEDLAEAIRKRIPAYLKVMQNVYEQLSKLPLHKIVN